MNFQTQHGSSRLRGYQPPPHPAAFPPPPHWGGVLDHRMPGKQAGGCTYRVALECGPGPLWAGSAISPANSLCGHQLPNIPLLWLPPPPPQMSTPRPPGETGDQCSLGPGPWGSETCAPLWRDTSQKKRSKVNSGP